MTPFFTADQKFSDTLVIGGLSGLQAIVRIALPLLMSHRLIAIRRYPNNQLLHDNPNQVPATTTYTTITLIAYNIIRCIENCFIFETHK